MAIRNQEQIYFSIKDYDNAEMMRAKGQKVEAQELAIAEERMRVTMEQQSGNLKHKQD